MLNLFEEQDEELSLERSVNPFFELYDGQHTHMYQTPPEIPIQKKTVNLNKMDSEDRAKHIEKIKKRLAKMRR